MRATHKKLFKSFLQIIVVNSLELNYKKQYHTPGRSVDSSHWHCCTKVASALVFDRFQFIGGSECLQKTEKKQN
jgi:hypothetical protein